MWIFLNNAMISVVAHRTKPGMVMVRARVKGDIERTFPRAVVSRTPDADYLYRAEMKQATVAKAIAEAIEDIDYTNFKASIATRDKERYDAYSWVWEEMLQLQDRLEPPVRKRLDNLEIQFPGGDE